MFGLEGGRWGGDERIWGWEEGRMCSFYVMVPMRVYASAVLVEVCRSWGRGEASLQVGSGFREEERGCRGIDGWIRHEEAGFVKGCERMHLRSLYIHG
jgi:hypothetical protein